MKFIAARKRHIKQIYGFHKNEHRFVHKCITFQTFRATIHVWLCVLKRYRYYFLNIGCFTCIKRVEQTIMLCASGKRTKWIKSVIVATIQSKTRFKRTTYLWQRYAQENMKYSAAHFSIKIFPGLWETWVNTKNIFFIQWWND